jgi:hypothetical protein
VPLIEARMILLAGYYEDADAARRAELSECLRRNLDNELLEEIHLFVEEPKGADELRATQPPLADGKIRLIEHGRRVTYRDLFVYANTRLRGRRVIVANADIFFDRTLARLDGYDLAGRLLCLSRWDIQGDGSSRFFEHPASQDAWVFLSPLPEIRCEFHLGLPGCDNRLAWEAARAGLVLSNPGRSVRAHHLHLSLVRHYDERRRLPGPTRDVPSGFLGTPWLWFVVPCMGRLDDLRATVGSLLSQPKSSCVLVDYSCPDGAGRWARAHHPEVVVTTVEGRRRFRGAESRNVGADAADEDGYLCFLDPGVRAAPGFSEFALAECGEGVFLTPERRGPGFDSVLVCRKSDFERVGGFEEVSPGGRDEECEDLKARLRRAGLSARHIPAPLLSTPCGCANRRAGVVEEFDARAEVSFREGMGYTVERLEAGVSSHNNDSRPFEAIPAQLAGLEFTQVVSSSVSPVEVEFLTAGKLYVLVGDDWGGQYMATEWLRRMGFREGLPKVKTARGSGFEVWSLAGEAGERFVLPTQVMLAAVRLVKE